MIKQVFNYFLKVVGAAYSGLLAMIIVIIPIRLITYDHVIEFVVSSVICVATSMAVILVLCMKDGYDDDGKVSLGKAILYMSLAVLLYDLLTVILQYYTGAATNVCDIAIVIKNLDRTTSLKEMADEHGGAMFVSLIIQTIPFIPAMIAGYMLGGKKRQRSRQKLTGE
jgi:uncharacterized membrane protein (Fun14 family)